MIRFPVLYKEKIETPPPIIETTIIHKPRIIEQRIIVTVFLLVDLSTRLFSLQRPPAPPTPPSPPLPPPVLPQIIVEEYEEPIAVRLSDFLFSIVRHECSQVPTPPAVPLLCYLARENYLTELEFDQTADRPPEKLHPEAVSPPHLDRLTNHRLISDQTDRLRIRSRETNCDLSIARDSRVQSAGRNVEIRSKKSSNRTGRNPNSLKTPHHLSSLQIRPRTYNFDFEEQFAHYRPQEFDEFHPPEFTLDYEPSALSLKYVSCVQLGFSSFIVSLFRRCARDRITSITKSNSPNTCRSSSKNFIPKRKRCCTSRANYR